MKTINYVWELNVYDYCRSNDGKLKKTVLIFIVARFSEITLTM